MTNTAITNHPLITLRIMWQANRSDATHFLLSPRLFKV